MPFCKDREYRALVSFGAEKKDDKEEKSYKVSGYASTFDTYTLFEVDGIEYKERIDSHAFDDADMTDVIMQYDHAGRVFARTSNGTLTVSVDERGLKIEADLSTTEASRELYDEIAAGLIIKMSFAFKVADEHYDSNSHTRVIDSIAKVFDVSAVSIPANENTEIFARSAFFDGVIEKEKAERLEQTRKETERRKLKLRLQLMEVSK